MRPEGSASEDEIKKMIAGFPQDPSCRLINISLSQSDMTPVRFDSDKPIKVLFEYEILQPTFGFHAFFRLCDNEDAVLFESIDTAEDENLSTLSPGVYRSTATIPANLLGARRYELLLGVGIAHRRYCTPELIRFPIEVDLTGRINQALPGYASPGKLLPSIPWRVEQV
jgi:hypothetical protein